MEKSILAPGAIKAIAEVLKDAYKDYKSGFDTDEAWNATVWAYKAICTKEEWRKVYREFGEWKGGLQTIKS